MNFPLVLKALKLPFPLGILFRVLNWLSTYSCQEGYRFHKGKLDLQFENTSLKGSKDINPLLRDVVKWSDTERCKNRIQNISLIIKN